MVTIEKIRAEIFDEIYASFLDDGDRFLAQEDWRPLFARAPLPGQEHCGYALVDGSQVVGLLGMLFSQRDLNGRHAQFCNLHSWYVKEAYRGKSMLLMRPALRLTDHTLTDFTPTERVCAISARLGFRPLDAALRILLPLSRKAQHRHGAKCEITRDARTIATRLSSSDAQLFRDHQVQHCEHLLASDEQQYCYLIYTKVRRCRLPYRQIHYISNKPFFERALPQIRSYLLAGSDAYFAAVDDRLVAAMQLPFSFRLPIQSRQLYRSRDVGPADIDHLYSEVSFLGLSTLPSLRYRVRRMANRLGIEWALPGEPTSLETRKVNLQPNH